MPVVCGLLVENILLDTMFDLPDLEGVDEIVIDKDVVAGTKEPGQGDCEKQQSQERRRGLALWDIPSEA